jgi:hypothetical protein
MSAFLTKLPDNGQVMRHIPLVRVFDQADGDKLEEVDVAVEAAKKEKFKTQAQQPMNGWLLEEELWEVEKFLKTLEKPSVLSMEDLKLFLRYALHFFIQNRHLYQKGRNGWHQKVMWKSKRESALKGVHEELSHKGVFST